MSGVMGLKKTFLGHQLVDKARPCHFVFNLQLVWFLFFFLLYREHYYLPICVRMTPQ